MRFPSLPSPPVFVGRLLRALVLLGFAVLVGRHWHPYYGFTSFLQVDASMAQVALPAFRDDAVYVYPTDTGYDGGYYAQIATAPALRDPALRSAIDDLGYRARRILLGAVAWTLGGGEPVATVRAYAALNIAVWFGLAALLWGLFAVADWRGTAAWAAVLASAGALLSVRLALTDLTALLLVAGGICLVERGRPIAAAALLGVAGLARETALLGAAALLPANGRGRIMPLAGRLALAALPLFLWLLYVRLVVGGSSAGQSNFSWPLAGWAARWIEFGQSAVGPENPRLLVESILEHLALTVQIAYLAWRPRRECPWWRVGVAYAVLALCLGPSVWGGFPNAASRVLLPLTLAFNVRAVRDRARLAWFILGNLSVFAGVHALEAPAGTPHELPAHGTWSSRQMLATDARWAVAEWNSKHRWAWCAGDGGLTFRAWPRPPRLKLELEVRAITPRPLEVRAGGAVVWRGDIGTRPQWIPLPELPADHGRLALELHSPGPAKAEGADNTAREISFACFGARVAP